ncbi:MAG: AAA family ATPase [Desulfuromonas sp. SDB]|nr:MAG: AAA family ATPase [Desulfuromonas sp. SDB]
MKIYQRFLDLKLPPHQSAFLWGARKTGKTTYLKQKFPKSIYYDLLKTDLYFDLLKRPSLLREQLSAEDSDLLKQPIIIDEVQKIPQLLDEIHWLIENKNLSFILCGSSARKIIRNKANLLGGRAWRYNMLPLTSVEINEYKILKILNHGLIPSHYNDENYPKSLKSYVYDYLKQEVFNEGLTRNIPAFSRFFDSLGYSHGELINYSNIARDCGIDSKTVKEYFQILSDTLLGYFLLPYQKKANRQIITATPKFYLFDLGVAGILTNRQITDTKGISYGKAFEHFIFMELHAYKTYLEKNWDIKFWRTKSHQEVDFILGEAEIAIEVKSSANIKSRDTKSLRAFSEEHKPRKQFIICNENKPRIVNDINITPWNIFLEKLWSDKIIS